MITKKCINPIKQNPESNLNVPHPRPTSKPITKIIHPFINLIHYPHPLLTSLIQKLMHSLQDLHALKLPTIILLLGEDTLLPFLINSLDLLKLDNRPSYNGYSSCYLSEVKSSFLLANSSKKLKKYYSKLIFFIRDLLIYNK